MTSDTMTTIKNLSFEDSGPMWAPVQIDYKGHSSLRSSHTNKSEGTNRNKT